MRHWSKRKLTKADGEYILWHVLEHMLRERIVYGIELACGVTRRILATFKEVSQ